MKKILIALSILLVLGAVGLYFYLKKGKLKDFEPQIKERLSQLVKDGSNGLYRLDIGSIEPDVVNSKINVINVRLSPDSTVYAKLVQAKMAPNDLFDVTVSQISLDNIIAADFVTNKAINLGRLFINNPVITVTHAKQDYNQKNSDTAKTVWESINKDISSIKLDTLILQNIDFTYKNKDKKNKETKLANVKVFFSDILIDSTTQDDHERILFAKNCQINVKDYQLNTSDSLYRFKVADIDIQSTRKTIALTNISFEPRVSAKEFYSRLKHQQDRFTVAVKKVSFNEVNWWPLLSEESFRAEKVTLQGGSIKVYNDKSQPLDTRSKVGKYPHQLLMKLPFTLEVKSMDINNLDVSYTELNPKSSEAGTLIFDNINGKLSNITNDPLVIAQNPLVKIEAKTMFMKVSPLKASFLFDLRKHKTSDFGVTASLGQINADALNPITMPLGMLKVNTVNIKSLDASIRGNNSRGSGTVKMIYEDLNVTALKAKDDTLKKRGLLTFIANTFVIKKQNPDGSGRVRTEQAAYERDIIRSFFNLVWKTIFTGAGKTVGYNKK